MGAIVGLRLQRRGVYKRNNMVVVFGKLNFSPVRTMVYIYIRCVYRSVAVYRFGRGCGGGDVAD